MNEEGSYRLRKQENKQTEETPFEQFQSTFQNQQQFPDMQTPIVQQPTSQIKHEFFLSGGESLLSKMGGMLVAKAFLPSGNHIKQALTYMDLAIKIEIVLHEMQSTLFWCSVLEFGLFFLSLFLFFTDPTEMVYIWMHIFHIGRAIIGYILQKKLPRSHQMAANMSIPSDESMHVEGIMKYLLLAAKDALTDFTTQTRKWLLLYFGSTIICVILDMIEFFIQVKDFARVQSAFADLTLIAIASIFLFIDWFYLLWITSLSYKFPSYISLLFIKSLFGVVETIHKALGNYIDTRKQTYSERYTQQQQRFNYITNGNYSQSIQQPQVVRDVNYPIPRQDSEII